MDAPPRPQLPQIGQLFSESWHIFTTNFAKLLVISLIPAGIGLVVGLLVAILTVIFSSFSKPFEAIIPFLPILIPLALIIVISLIILFTWNQIALLLAIKSALDHTSWTISSVYKSAWPKIGAFWWLGFVSGFSILGGFMFFAIPGLIMSVWFSFAIYILVEEHLGGINNLLKSRAYVKNYFWPVFGRQFLVWLVIFIISMIASVFSFIPVIGSLAQAALQLITGIFTAIYSYVLFRSLKSTHPVDQFSPSSSSKTLVIISIIYAIILPVIIILISTAIMAASLAS